MKNSSSATRVARFVLSGVIAALAEFSSFLIFIHVVLLELAVAQSISFMFGLTTSYILNKFWVFKSKGKIRDELPKYALLATINLVFSNLLLALLHSTGIVAWLAKLVVMASVALWNFFIFQKLIFGANSSEKDE